MLTRRDLREEIAKVFGFHMSAVTNGSFTTVVDTSLIAYANDYWNGAHVLLLSSDGLAPNGESRVITDYDAGTTTMQVLPAFSNIVEPGDTYQIYRNVTPDEINLAINRACKGMEVMTSITPSTSQLDYQLTAAPGLQRRQQIISVGLRSGNRLNVMPEQLTDYQIEDAEGVLTLRIPHLLRDDDHLWVHYFLDGNSITEDTDMVNLPADLIRARVVNYLLELVIGRQGTQGMEKWGQLTRYWGERLTEAKHAHQYTSKRTRNHNWFGNRRRSAEDALNIASIYE